MANRGKVRSSRRKVKGRMKFAEYMKLVRKDSVQTEDTIPKAPAKVYPENAVHFKVKIKKK